MLEGIDRTDWVEESKNTFNYIGKNIGLKELVNVNYSNLEERKFNKLFINPIDKESIERLTSRIYVFVEKWYLFKRNLPKFIVLSKKDYNRLLEETNIIDGNCILGIKVDILKERKIDYREKKYDEIKY